MAEVARVLLVLRIDLEDDVVLVELREDDRDLALAEGVVERIVDGRGGQAQARGGVAVEREVGAQAGGLLVAGYVGQLRQRPELVD